MKFFRAKYFVNVLNILIILSCLGFGYYYRDNLVFIWRSVLNRAQPCARPIKYSLAAIDPRFGLTREKLLAAIKQAEEIWETPINQQLFEYSPAGDLKISLIYDYRQQATDDLKKLGLVLNDDQVTYDAVKAKYDSLLASYNKQKAYLTALINNYEADQREFKKAVDSWNGRHQGSNEEYQALQQRQIELNNQVAIINQTKDSLNVLVGNLNSIKIVLDNLIVKLNLQVATYNTVGASAGQEFNEGEYIGGPAATAINIFQFNNADSLIRVLAHEFGHALGLEHLDNPKAIMYRLNQAANDQLTADDLTALKQKCRLQ